MASTLALIIWGCDFSKIFGDWKYVKNYDIHFETMDLSRPRTDRHEIRTQVDMTSRLKTYFGKFFFPTPKKIVGEKAQI